MMRLASKFSRVVRNGIGLKPPFPPPSKAVAPPVRQFSGRSGTFTPNPVALQMINYATSLAREKKTGAHPSYLLVIVGRNIRKNLQLLVLVLQFQKNLTREGC